MDERTDALTARVDALCCEYSSVPPDQLLPRVAATMRMLNVLRGRSGGLTIRRDLLVAEGWAALLAACLEQDQNNAARAAALASMAETMGAEAGHQPISIWAREIKAWQAINTGRYAETATIARDAADLAPDTNVAVQLHVQEAKARSRMADGRAARVALNRAERALEGLPAPDRPEHHFIFDRSKFAFYAVQTFDIAGDDRGVAEYAQDCYFRCVDSNAGTTRWPMRTAEIQLALAHSAARAGSLDVAAGYGLQALNHGRQSGPSLLPRALDLDAVLYRRWPGGWETRQFRVALRQLQHRYAAS
ncbi:MAG TPA: hypothetical protein VF109_02220 [Mycobacteriales bacterium]